MKNCINGVNCTRLLRMNTYKVEIQKCGHVNMPCFLMLGHIRIIHRYVLFYNQYTFLREGQVLHFTPASSEWVQLCSLIDLAEQLTRAVSLPTQFRSSS